MQTASPQQTVLMIAGNTQGEIEKEIAGMSWQQLVEMIAIFDCPQSKLVGKICQYKGIHYEPNRKAQHKRTNKTKHHTRRDDKKNKTSRINLFGFVSPDS